MFDSVPCITLPALCCAVPVTTGSFWMIATSDELLAIHLGLVDL